VVHEKLCTARNALQNEPNDEEACEGYEWLEERKLCFSWNAPVLTSHARVVMHHSSAAMQVTSSYELGSNEIDAEFQEANEHSACYVNPTKIVWESNEFVDSDIIK
jgi:hypothetical protein